jgi:N-acetylmuramoyl-L-alanine amidase
MSARFVVLCVATLGLTGAGVFGCGSSGKNAADAGADGDVSRARVIVAPGSALPPRPEAITVAQSVESLALKEGAGPRAVELHALAASVHERLWRIEHKEQDAKEALELYRAAGKDLTAHGACDAAVRSAKLAGEVARDAQTTYAELYRVKRRGAGSPCGAAVDEPLAVLAAFRPPSPVLDAIDQGLVAEGAIATALADAGGASGAALKAVAAPRIVRLEHWGGTEAARVVVHLDRAAKPFHVGDQSGRTFVELDGVEPGNIAHETPLGGIVTRVVAEPMNNGTRIALDLSGPGYRRVFHLLEPYRVVIDIAKRPPGSTRTVERVVIDPGHGGTDPGALGPTGLKEKDVTLAVAHKVAPTLARLGVQVALTRDDDRFVTLEERTARANAFGADLFVSIHCNAAENKARHGIETYVLDTTTSDMAGRVAARENATSQAASNEVAQLLASMRLADQATRSTKLAELLQRSAMASVTTQFPDASDGGVHRAAFYVLVGARMPAVLFETSYISNANEEQRLGSEQYQQRLADAVVNAVKAYKEGR